MIEVIGPKSVSTSSTLVFAIFVTVSDGDTLSYSASNLPDGAGFDSTTQTFSWTPVDGQEGGYVVSFEVSDGVYSDEEMVVIIVTDSFSVSDCDMNSDGLINLSDLFIIGFHFGEDTSKPFPKYDLIQDGEINILDISLVGQHYGKVI